MTAFKIADLTGYRLDTAVAMVEGRYEVSQTAIAAAGCEDLAHYLFGRESEVRWPDPPGRFYHPSRDWRDAGPIIEREKISVEYWGDERVSPWMALLPRVDYHVVPASCGGPTPLIAAMRAYVASKFGDTVDLPD